MLERYVYLAILLVSFYHHCDSLTVSFKEQNLKCHNQHRAQHRVGPLKYTTELQKAAQRYADYLAAKNSGLAHEPNSPYGENLFYSSGLRLNGSEACELWYAENKKYDYNKGDPDNFPQVGHFTQLVWKGTKSIGIGIAVSKAGSSFVVAKYAPPGNYMGEYRSNVLPPKMFII